MIAYWSSTFAVYQINDLSASRSRLGLSAWDPVRAHEVATRRAVGRMQQLSAVVQSNRCWLA